MRTITAAASCVVGIVSIVWSAAVMAQEPAKAPSPTTMPVFVKYEEAKWQKIVPELGDDGPEIAILHVDAKSGATQLLIRMNAAMHVPLHFHSANETHTLIKGEAGFECGGMRGVLGVGGFNYLPAKEPHQAWASAGSVVFITVDGPWDVNWVAGPPTRADLGEAAVASVLKTAAR